jgi:hypothetical protein
VKWGETSRPPRTVATHRERPRSNDGSSEWQFSNASAAQHAGFFSVIDYEHSRDWCFDIAASVTNQQDAIGTDFGAYGGHGCRVANESSTHQIIVHLLPLARFNRT